MTKILYMLFARSKPGFWTMASDGEHLGAFGDWHTSDRLRFIAWRSDAEIRRMTAVRMQTPWVWKKATDRLHLFRAGQRHSNAIHFTSLCGIRHGLLQEHPLDGVRCSICQEGAEAGVCIQ